MVEETANGTELVPESTARITDWQRFRKLFFQRKLVVVGLAIVLFFVIVAIFGPLVAPYDPYVPDVKNILAKPSLTHLLGTDVLGRDTLSRLIYGARTALTVGIITITIGTSIGIVLGLIAGYFGGAISTVIMRFMDVLLSFPMLLLALIIASLLGGGIHNVIIALSISTIGPYSRIVNGQTISIKENDYIMAARTMGSSTIRIIFRHILLNIIPTIIVLVTMQLGTLILAEAGLSFLGIGIKPPGAAWGSMINDGYKYLLSSPVLSFAPGVCIMLVVFGFMMVGDGLRDALDPRLRGTL
jgi:peptide/nickel transport system permease protein